VIDLFDIAVDSGFHGDLYEFHLTAFARLDDIDGSSRSGEIGFPA
jgi:hypothetical protein